MTDTIAERNFLRHLDARDLRPLVETFHPDAELDSPTGLERGHGGITEYYRNRFVSFGTSQHFVTLLRDEPNGDGGRRTDWNSLTLLAGSDGDSVLAFGRYTFVVDAEERIRRLDVRIDFTFVLGPSRPYKPGS